MSSVPPTLTELDWLVSQAWETLCVPASGKNGIFAKVFYEEEVLFDIASDANLMFCPGLLDVVLSPTPPDIDFFKKLPVKYLGLWGVYCLVLEKPGCIPVIYIGEASNKDKGIPLRWRAYNNPDVYREELPSKVRDFLDDGYKITHKAVLVYAPIPSAGDVPRVRCLFYVLEATFAFYFWAMFGDKDYQIESCCPWDRKSLTYGGLCSHSSLNDPMKANLKLSREELEELAAEAAEEKRLKKNRAGREFREREKRLDPEGVKQKNRDRYINNKEAMTARTKACKDRRMADPVRHDEWKADERKKYPNKREAILASKKYYCATCNTACGKPGELANHMKSATHLRRVKWAEEGTEGLFHCEPCDKYFDKAKTLRSHQKSGPHYRKVNSLPRTPNADVAMPDVVDEDGPVPKEVPTVTKEVPQSLYCDICDRLCVNLPEFEWHNKSDKHLARVAKVAAGVEFNHRCDVCMKSFENASILRMHEKTQKHKAKVAELQEAEEDDY